IGERSLVRRNGFQDELHKYNKRSPRIKTLLEKADSRTSEQGSAALIGELRGLREEVITIVERDADVDRKIQDFVVTKGGIICQLPQKKIDAVIVLLGCFYVFNVSYTQRKAILTFLDQALLESGLG
ncbi:unnamed protein product, partial [Porites evermanni]